MAEHVAVRIQAEQFKGRLSWGYRGVNLHICEGIAWFLQEEPDVLKEIDLQGNEFGPAEAAALADGFSTSDHHDLKGVKGLKSVKLKANNLGGAGEGFDQFCNAIRNANIQYLDLRRNNLGPGHALLLANCLQQGLMSDLYVLDIRENPIGDEGGKAFLEVLSKAPRHFALKLAGCGVKPEILVAIGRWTALGEWVYDDDTVQFDEEDAKPNEVSLEDQVGAKGAGYLLMNIFRQLRRPDADMSWRGYYKGLELALNHRQFQMALYRQRIHLATIRDNAGSWAEV